MKEQAKRIAVVFFAVWAGSGLASTRGDWVDVCDGCALWQVEARAARYPVSALSKVHVLDYHNAVVWSCDVVREKELGTNLASCGPASSEAQQAFREIVDIVRELKAEVSIPYPGGNIHDIAGCPACARQWLLDNRYRLANQLSLLDLLVARGLTLSVAINVSVASISATYGGQIRVKVVLDNDASGGREKAHCIGVLTDTGLVIDADQCFDSDGNPIPTLGNPGLQDAYVFLSAVNQQSMVNRIRALGRPVRHGGTVTVGQLGRIDCNSHGCESKEKPPSPDRK
ncbi:hypothetical protein [Silanimonas lenta]|uniref:hypothetical protein n=1 Tax=Silanimonas lenta TaxID=265429 RepID=UPI0012EBD048|nr:hypothetical protein [Silanimonas lenta]